MWLPFCSAPGQAVTFPDAVFTAATSVCVTGLSTVVMATQWSHIGKIVILCLIQIGGIGLIIVSGLGFIVWWDLWDKFRKIIKRELSPGRFFRVLRLQSKLDLTMTGILVFAGALFVFIFESRNPLTLADKPLGIKIMASFFQSVTTRTAGFYTIDQSQLSTPTVIISLLWMFIGGSPNGS